MFFHFKYVASLTTPCSLSPCTLLLYRRQEQQEHPEKGRGGPSTPGWYPRLYSHCCILQHFCEMEGPRQRWLCHRPLSAALPEMLNSKTIATFIIKQPPPVFCWEMMELLSTVRTFLSLVRTPGGHAWCRSYSLAYMPTRYHPAMLLCTQMENCTTKPVTGITENGATLNRTDFPWDYSSFSPTVILILQ